MKQTLLVVIRWVRTFIRERFHAKNENLPYYLTIAVSAVLFIIAMNLFVGLTDELAENDLVSVDEAVSEYIVSYRSEALTSYFTLVTDLGDRYTYIILTVLLAAYFFFKNRSWKFIGQTTIVLLLASLSSVVLKRVFNRSRPSLEHLVEVNTLSYPSGHSMSAMAFYGFLVYLCVRHGMPGWFRGILITVLVFLILSIGVSRIYLGVHYPTDVAGGFIGGLIWVAFCAVVFSIFELLRRRQSSREAAEDEANYKP
ncbi:MAG TPA: phosphatase PAP2 family protein [Chryseosolibacter sp.]|nr:phosphatase PAP2 family protein [Chryseosolibacter sp.]